MNEVTSGRKVKYVPVEPKELHANGEATQDELYAAAEAEVLFVAWAAAEAAAMDAWYAAAEQDM